MVGVVGAPERAELAERDRRPRWSSWPSRANRPNPAPDFSRICISLSPISLIALIPGNARPLAVDELHRISQPPVAVHEFAHRSALGAMRAAIDRRSQLGSWPTQTPLTTSAVTVQPTEQCVQMLLRMVAPEVQRARRALPPCARWRAAAHRARRDRRRRGPTGAGSCGGRDRRSDWLANAAASEPRRAGVVFS